MTYEEFQDKFHIKLNWQQLVAVHSVDGPVLLLAVPGSGKTTVLVTRLGYMVYCAGIAPGNILTLTYTVSAARDMSERFSSFFGSRLGGRLEFRTINGICAKVIQYYGNLIGKSPFSLVTENDFVAKMLSDIYRKVEDNYATESDLKGIRAMITYIKNMMLTAEEIRKLDEEADFTISEIYKAYNDELHAQNLMDYDDQMIYAYNILRRSPETLLYFQEKYSYLCVDEAQDTSRIQHEIIRLLAGMRDNLFMVGDEDQSIYGFRAAYPEALLSFEKDHAGAKVLLMEENFRSNAKIVTAADRFIQRNVLRHEKHMTAAREAGTDIQRVVLKNRNAQYEYLAGVAGECRGQTAVLYRNNESVLPLVDLLDRRGIPYSLRSAELTFFTHRIVLDIRNIIEFAMNPKDSELFLQIYYKIATYIKKQDAFRICELHGAEGRDILDLAIRYGQLPPRTVQSCRVLRSHLKCLLSERADMAINRIIYSMGYGEYLERMGIGDSKLYILKQLARNEDSLQGFLERLDELQEIMQGKQSQRILMKEGKDRNSEWLTDSGDIDGMENLGNSEGANNLQPLILSTIHSSKGLEYDTVYLLDVVDSVFPESIPKNLKTMDKKEHEAYEEERRLFYVGVTRARDNLTVFKLDQKSSFNEELLKKEKKKAFSPKEYDEYLKHIGEGLIVTHRRYGEGVVAEVHRDTVLIQFEGETREFQLKILYEHKLLAF